MQVHRFLVTVLLTLFLLIPNVYGQEEPEVKVQISKNKVMIQGKVYYVHIVKDGETLFSISQAYGIPQIDIAKENPDLYWGLQAGQAVKIPFSVDDDKKEEYVFHIVKAKETVFSISQFYSVPRELIYEANSGSEDGIYINQVLRIPNKEFKAEKHIFNKENDKYYYHKIEAEETLWSIAKLYNIKYRRLKRVNKSMKEDELAIGQYIRIPKDYADTIESVILKQKEDTYAGVELTTPVQSNYEQPEIECPEVNGLVTDRTYKVALMLPFQLNKNVKPVNLLRDSLMLVNPDSVLASEEGKPKIDWNSYVYKKSKKYIEFYQGALVAIRELKMQGLSVELFVYDTERKAEKAEELIQNPEFMEMDMIIGPVFPGPLNVVSKFSMENRINMISPLSQADYELNTNPFLFQVTPSYKVQVDEYSKHIAEFYNDNMVLIHAGDTTKKHVQLINVLKERLFSSISFHAPVEEVLFKELAYNKEVFHNDTSNSFEQTLDKDKKNIVIVPSNSEAFVNQVIANMNYFKNIGYDIELFGYQRWKNFKPNVQEYFYSMEMKNFDPYHVDYSQETVKDFIRDYRYAYASEPDNYAFQGYDVTKYFLYALKKYGPDFQYCLKYLNLDLIQSDYRFERTDGYSGFENKSVFMLKYNKDYTIEKIK